MKLRMDWLTSNWLTWLGFILVTGGGILTLISTFINDDKAKQELKETKRELKETISAKDAKIDSISISNERISKSNEMLIILNSEAIENNDRLISKVEVYQKSIEERDRRIQKLEISVKKAKRGISSSKNFNGTHSIKDGSSTGIVVGTEEEMAFKDMVNLEKKQDWIKLIKLCDEFIKSSPDWYTSYLFKASTLLIVNRKKYEQTSFELFDFVEENTVGDPQYLVPISDTYKVLGYPTKSKEVLRSVDPDQLARYRSKFKQ